MTTYQEMNATWPRPYPVPTPQEAIAGTKRLMRVARRLARQDGQPAVSLYRIGYKFKLVSGRLRNGPDALVWSVNPNEANYWGWHEIVHAVSHWAQYHYWHGKTHGPRHVWIEAQLTDYALKNLIDGQLRREPKPKPKADPVLIRRARVDAAIKRWQAKKRRAENALRKLRRQERYYERRCARYPAVSTARAGDTGTSGGATAEVPLS